MGELVVRALAPETWHGFAALAERHNGVWGGCWCTYFHTMHDEKTFEAESNRDLKHRLVLEGRAHAALVFDGERAVGWLEYGTPAELPNIYHRKEYEAGLEQLPDYRLTCFFTDRSYRHRGVSTRAARRSPPPSSTTAPAPSSKKPASPTSAPRARTTAS